MPLPSTPSTSAQKWLQVAHPKIDIPPSRLIELHLTLSKDDLGEDVKLEIAQRREESKARWKMHSKYRFSGERLHTEFREKAMTLWSDKVSYIMKNFMSLKVLEVDIQELLCPLGCCRMKMLKPHFMVRFMNWWMFWYAACVSP